jgi:hypothetical protein
MDPPKGSQTYVSRLHRWVHYWDKKLAKVKWSKVPMKGGGTGNDENGGAGSSPPPPKWPP